MGAVADKLNISTVDWTVQEKLNRYEDKRKIWDEDFKANYKEVAMEISEYIAKRIFKNLNKRLNDSYKKLPKLWNPIKLKYKLDIRSSNCGRADIRWMAKESLELPPFKEWFTNMRKSRMDDYFLNKFTLVRKEVKLQVRKKLKAFVKETKENSALHFHIKWTKKNKEIWDYLFKSNFCTLQISLWVGKKAKQIKVLEENDIRECSGKLKIYPEGK